MSDRRITQAGIRAAAADLGVDLATIKAVLDVESSGNGFLKSGKPKILFEGHIFHKITKGRFTSSHPSISYPKWTKKYYLGGEREWRRFNEAFELDPNAAMRAASWGLGQIIGDNFKAAGFKTVDAFVDAMKRGEDQQLQAMVDFIQANHLDDELQALNFAGFAKGYNGPGYKRNNYDGRLTTARRRHLKDNNLPMTQVPDHQEEMIGDVDDDGEVEPDLTSQVTQTEPEPQQLPVKVEASGEVVPQATIVVPPPQPQDNSGRKSFWATIIAGITAGGTWVISNIAQIFGKAKDSGFDSHDAIRWTLVLLGVIFALYMLRQLVMGVVRLVGAIVMTRDSMKFQADKDSNNVVVGQPAPGKEVPN